MNHVCPSPVRFLPSSVHKAWPGKWPTMAAASCRRCQLSRKPNVVGDGRLKKRALEWNCRVTKAQITMDLNPGVCFPGCQQPLLSLLYPFHAIYVYPCLLKHWISHLSCILRHFVKSNYDIFCVKSPKKALQFPWILWTPLDQKLRWIIWKFFFLVNSPSTFSEYLKIGNQVERNRYP